LLTIFSIHFITRAVRATGLRSLSTEGRGHLGTGTISDVFQLTGTRPCTSEEKKVSEDRKFIVYTAKREIIAS